MDSPTKTNSRKKSKSISLSHNIKRIDGNASNAYYVPQILDTPKLDFTPEQIGNITEEVESDSDSIKDAQKLYKTNIFIYCIHCSSMIMVMSDNEVPFTILADKDVKNKCSIFGTTCRQCTKKYTPLLQNNKTPQEPGYSFEKSFKLANISSKILETSHVYRIAKAAIKRDIVIVKDDDECLLYEKRNTVLTELTDKCYVIGIKTDELDIEHNDNVFMVFLRGGFL